MSTLLIKNVHTLITMDSGRRELHDAFLFARNGIIEAVGSAAEVPQSADTVLDGSGRVVIPGLVNTHHHMYQTLTRVLAQDNLHILAVLLHPN